LVLRFFAFFYIVICCTITIVFRLARDIIRVIENTVVFSLNRSCLTKSTRFSDIPYSTLLRIVHYDGSLYRSRLASHPIQELLPPSWSSSWQTILIQPLSKLRIILRYRLRLHECLTQLVLGTKSVTPEGEGAYMTPQSIRKDDFHGRRLIKGMSFLKVRILWGERFEVPDASAWTERVLGPCLK